ncbi:MAG: ABC transporter ATP-binding protein [Terriglobales bacterium]
MDRSSEPFSQVRDLAVTYRSENGAAVRALDGVSLEIRSGEVIGILGESGCGKSTLARSFLGLLGPNARCEGTILIRGQDLLTLSGKELQAIRGRKISIIPQDPAVALNPVLTSGAQIGEVLRAHFPGPARPRRAQVMDLLSDLGFDHRERVYSAYPHQLSGGQRQRIAIAQAVACRPDLLIADEPTSKLDRTLETEIIALLSKIRRQHGTAILVIGHDPTLFAGFADRMAVMYAGRIVEVGSSSEIFRRPLHPYTQALLRIASSAVLSGSKARVRLPTIEGESFTPTSIGSGCRFVARCSDRMEVCTHRYPGEFLPEPARPVNCFKYGE